MSDRTTPRRRLPRKATAAYLERAALFHLQRYATTTAMLRRVLLRRAARSARAHGTDPAAGRAMVEALLERFARAGLLDDARFARARAESLLARGTSPRAIAFKLKARGVSPGEVRSALAALSDCREDPELEAAMALARRRRLGPFGQGVAREREVAALLRAGFSWSVAKRVLGAPTAR